MPFQLVSCLTSNNKCMLKTKQTDVSIHAYENHSKFNQLTRENKVKQTHKSLKGGHSMQ